MNDNIKRGLRTAGQALVGFLGSGAVTLVWNDYLGRHGEAMDPTVTLGIGLVLTAVVGWAQNAIEDKTGHGILVPRDRIEGDQQLGTGIGAKQG